MAIGACVVDCGTSLNSWGIRCDPRASSLLVTLEGGVASSLLELLNRGTASSPLGILARGIASSLIGSSLARGFFIDIKRLLASSSLGVGCDSRCGRVGAGAAMKERSWYECRDCDPLLPSRSLAMSLALRILNGATA